MVVLLFILHKSHLLIGIKSFETVIIIDDVKLYYKIGFV